VHRDRASPVSGPLIGAPNLIATPHLAASTDEAQDRAGVIVAEQVVAALEGELLTNAVNIPSVGAEDLEVLGPFVPLAASLGRFALELAHGERRIDSGLSALGKVTDLAHEQLDASRRRLLQSDHQPDERRLAASVWSCDRHELALLHFEVDIPQHGGRMPVGERDALQLER